MKRKQLLKNLPGLMLAGALCFCMTVQSPPAVAGRLGVQSVEAAENGEEVKADSSSSSKGDAKKHTSEMIAVVNLDEGIKEDGKTVVYADRIVSLPNEKTYRFTSLSDAKEGVENGTYGAYILIPATFSKTVASINSSPQTCQLSYAVDRNMDADLQYKLLHEIFSFNTDLNNDLSYMYLENIMSEFHTAQDNARQVMSNDKRDKEAIDNISPNDLVSMVKLPEMKQKENDVPVLDISSYTSNITSTLGEIDSSLNAGVQEVNENLQLILQTGSELQKQLTEIWTGVDELPKLDKIDAKQYMETAAENFKKVSDEAKTFADGCDRQLVETGDEISTLVDKINQSLGANHGDLSYDMQSAIPYVSAEKAEDDQSYILCYKDRNSGQKIQNAPQLTLSLQSDESDINRANRVRGAYEIIMKAIRSGGSKDGSTVSYTSYEMHQQDTVEITYVDENGETHTVSGTPTSPVYTYTASEETINVDGGAKTTEQILAELDRDPNLDLGGYTSCAELLDNVQKDPSVLEPKKVIRITSGNENSFQTYMETVRGNVDRISKKGAARVDVSNLTEYDDQGNPVYEDGQRVTIQSRITELKDNKIAQMRKDFSEGVKKNAIAFEKTGEELTGSVDEAVDKVNEDIKTKSGKIKENIDNSRDAVQTYHQGVNEHRPTFNSEAAGKAGDIHSNASEMQSKVMENNAAHVEYANDVFTKANDNVNSLRQSIIDNQNASNEAVEKGLEDAKSVKESTSGQNQDLMKSFTEKLSYTRLGSLENTTTYKFIANPMVGVDESKDAVKILDSVKIGGADEVKSAVGQETGSTDGTKKRTVNVDKAAEPVKVITYVLVAALVLALAGLGGYICYLRKARRRHQMDY